jgi:hypothetical protein
MTRLTRGMMLVLTLAGRSVVGQGPAQFKANVKMVDASDGSTSTGMMYFGGAKTRTELTKDGQAVVVIADPAAKSQMILMPDDKMYMQMPMGQGPVNVSVGGPSDPTNPCSGGSGATDCVKGETESVNGHRAVRWDYTNAEGVRTRAWVSLTLRFPVKTEDDDGGKMELSNIAVGPQPASLFAAPAGYTKMDFGGMSAMGATGRGRGRGRAGGDGDPIAAAMAGLSPEMREAAAKAMRGQTPPAQTGAAIAGSDWEKGKGWVLEVTVLGTSSWTATNDLIGTARETFTGKFVASIPLNYGSPGIGVPGAPGPNWIHMPNEGMGAAEAFAVPLSFTVETEAKGDGKFGGACVIGSDANTSVTSMKGSAKKSVAIKKREPELIAQGMFKMSGDLKTYDLIASVSNLQVKEVTQINYQKKSCRDGHSYADSETKTVTPEYAFSIDIKGSPLPTRTGVVTGSKKMPLKVGPKELDATVSWTITPIR